jgi:hypothetical protein
MVKLVEMDEKATFFDQMEDNVDGVVIDIGKFNVNSEDVDQFVKTWASKAEIIRKQPGFLSLQLHRGIAGSNVFVNYAVWESIETLRKLLKILNLSPKLLSILLARLHLLTYSRK